VGLALVAVAARWWQRADFSKLPSGRAAVLES
jgi:hypothetical protein